MSKIRLSAKVAAGTTVIKAMITHPMETGFRRDPDSGQLVPAHFVEEIVFTHGDKVILTAQVGPAVAKNPYIAFRYKGGKVGEIISLRWYDSEGERGGMETAIEEALTEEEPAESR